MQLKKPPLANKKAHNQKTRLRELVYQASHNNPRYSSKRTPDRILDRSMRIANPIM